MSSTPPEHAPETNSADSTTTTADTDDDRTITVCPSCDSFHIRRYTGSPSISAGLSPGEYGCYDCGETFMTPATRPAMTDTPPRSGSLARKLYEADPDDVGSPDPYTGGGQ